VHRLVYYETYGRIVDAIHREKQLKSFRRQKKVTLIESVNRLWKDLAEDWAGLPG
jgi:Predicted endonuclease containing a URI domain